MYLPKTNALAVAIGIAMPMIVGIIVAYNVGVSRTTNKFIREQLEEQIRQIEIINETKNEVSDISNGLSLTLSKIETNREVENEVIDTKLDMFMHKYDNDGVYEQASSKDTSGYPSIPTTTKTKLGGESFYWRLYEQDRRFLLQEAARADKVTNLLNTCKTFVNEIYSAHDEYKLKIDEMKKQLSQ